MSGNISSIQECLNKDNSLSREIALFLLAYQEEDDRLDYKQAFDSTDKEWLEITKDISAFANTYGGYLVFGVEDVEKDVIGLPQAAATALKDSNRIQQKINRNLDPPIKSIRTAEYRVEGKSIIVMLVPRSENVTHLISKDGAFRYPNGGDSKTVLHKGTLYVRRVAGINLADSRDLDVLIDRRIEQFRESLINKIATVVNAPTSSEILVVAESPDDVNARKFVLSDGDDATPIKGFSITKPPQTLEEEVVAWQALGGVMSDAIPSAATYWKWFANRNKLNIGTQEKLFLFKLGLWIGAPKFFWIQGLAANAIRSDLKTAVRKRPNNFHLTEFVETAAYLGKSTHKSVIEMLGKHATRVSDKFLKIPDSGPRSYRTFTKKRSGETKAQFNSGLNTKLGKVCNDVVASGEPPKGLQAAEVIKLDIQIYARDDLYKG